ncbi:MAG: T9SS type A sorting domain-containing protein [Bacteroidia bacterium]|nr:T9SS type A sorting domain-containing protein [Bacteroidia bacterium]
MKHTFITSIIFTSAILNYSVATAEKINTPKDFKPKKSNGISFTENKGQVHDQNYKARPDVLFGGESNGLVFHLRNNGISYQLNKIESWKEVEDLKTKSKKKEIDQQTIYRLDINWLNANANASIIKGKALEGYSNFYLASCPDGATNVKSYADVTYKNIYNGIDLKWYQKDGQLKYDYLCEAGTNYKKIQLQIEGAESIYINKKGELLLKTPLGTIIEKAPTVVQNGKVLPSKWLIKNNIISFDIEKLDTKQAFIIDPAVRVWGTYYGGIGNDNTRSGFSDSFGNLYLPGDGNSNSNIATIGAHQFLYAGNSDAFLIKFNQLGIRLWGTYYGGSADDYALSCTGDASNNVYLAGSTYSSVTSISTLGSHQSSYGGSTSDAYLVKFNSSGVRLWGTYYGGSGEDYGYICQTNASGDVFLGGKSNSTLSSVISTPGSHQPAFGGGSDDGFLAKFSALGVRQWGTFYGGSGSEDIIDCIVDMSGSIYITGSTSTSTGTSIATLGAHQSVYGGGSNDAFMVKFNPSGIRQWGTYYGGTGTDAASSCALDPTTNLYLAGVTSSSIAGIATSGAHQAIYGGGTEDGFFVKFNNNGVRQWGSYYGGTNTENSRSIKVDAAGDIFIAGTTASANGTSIATSNGYQSTYGGGTFDAYLVKLDISGVRVWSTYYGGSGVDNVGGFCFGNTGSFYLSGATTTNSGTIIATVGSHQPLYGGGTRDGFLVRFDECVSFSPTVSVNGIVCNGSPINFTTIITGTATPSYTWSGPNSFTSNIQNPTIIGASTVNIGVYTLTVNNGGSCIETTTTQVTTVNSTPTITVNSGTICSGNNFTITPNGAITYTIQGGSNVVSPTSNTNYTVVGTSSAGCVSNTFVTSSVTVNTTPTITVNSGGICNGNSFTITPSGASNYTIQGGGAVKTPTSTTSYTVLGTSLAGCVSNVVTSNVTVNANPNITVNSGAICNGNSFTITPIGASTYTIQGGSSVVNPGSNTSYTVVGTSSVGCVSNTFATSNVTVNPTPTVTAISNTSLICVGSNANLTANGATTYSWSTGATTQSISVSPSVTTNYTVTGTLAGTGCFNTSIITQNVSTCTGIEKNSIYGNETISIYPNPTSNNITISGVQNVTKIELINSIGQIVFTENSVNATNSVIDLNQLPTGIYFVQLQTEQGSITKKIIKE